MRMAGSPAANGWKTSAVASAAGRKIILLLSAYDKGRDDSERRQQREIARARNLLARYRASRG